MSLAVCRLNIIQDLLSVSHSVGQSVWTETLIWWPLCPPLMSTLSPCIRSHTVFLQHVHLDLVDEHPCLHLVQFITTKHPPSAVRRKHCQVKRLSFYLLATRRRSVNARGETLVMSILTKETRWIKWIGTYPPMTWTEHDSRLECVNLP